MKDLDFNAYGRIGLYMLTCAALACAIETWQLASDPGSLTSWLCLCIWLYNAGFLTCRAVKHSRYMQARRAFDRNMREVGSLIRGGTLPTESAMGARFDQMAAALEQMKRNI